jgi:tRNA pseudouridine32 synthase/23S rRNA pseudouridine746 synthase
MSPPAEDHAGIEIVHASDRWCVIAKPAGMLSVPGKGPEKADCAAARVAKAFPNARGPLVVHRLDMETSGLLVFGLDEDAQRELSRQFENRVVEKSYIALVDATFVPGGRTPKHDPLTSEEGEIDLPMRPDFDRRPIQIVDDVHGRPARTRWRIMSREVDRVRLHLVPITGRTHQLRVHCAQGLGHTIVGDELYGAPVGSPRLMLHATTLSFLDPETGRRVEFEHRPEF